MHYVCVTLILMIIIWQSTYINLYPTVWADQTNNYTVIYSSYIPKKHQNYGYGINQPQLKCMWHVHAEAMCVSFVNFCNQHATAIQTLIHSCRVQQCTSFCCMTM